MANEELTEGSEPRLRAARHVFSDDPTMSILLGLADLMAETTWLMYELFPTKLLKVVKLETAEAGKSDGPK
jgi:hypothetical protein